MTERIFGIVANVIDDPILRRNARVWIILCNGDAERPKVTGFDQEGVRRTKYMPYKRLRNFRAQFIPETKRETIAWLFDKAKAEDIAGFLNIEADRAREVASRHSERFTTVTESVPLHQSMNPNEDRSHEG